MQVVIPGPFEQFVQQEVASGRFPSAEGVVLAGLELLRDRERRLEELRREIQIGLDELERGEGIELSEEGLDEFFEEIKREGRRKSALDEGAA